MFMNNIIDRIVEFALSIGLEEVMEFLGQSFPNVEIAIAHGKVIPFLHAKCCDIVQFFVHTFK